MLIVLLSILLLGYPGHIGQVSVALAAVSPAVVAEQLSAPAPLLEKGHPVQWWVVFKLNAAAFPGCGDGAIRSCIFGGDVQPYDKFSQQFVYASSENPTLRTGAGCLGDTLKDPVGATFDEVYNNGYSYVIWNDQFKDSPMATKPAPWGHSKGMLAWNDAGEGFVMQVTTPSWPASGSSSSPRQNDGNTLGCVDDNDVKVSQHFFALRLNSKDLVDVLKALQTANVVTDPTKPELVHNGGPANIQALVNGLGTMTHQKEVTRITLSSGVELITKPSDLHVPSWQMVSAILGGLPLRTATWWATPKIYTTTKSMKIACWSENLGKPGPVQIATTGSWDNTTFSFQGVPSNGNHAKIGISTDAENPYAIFGDLNQQGTVSGKNCASSQNGRGGTFYVIKNKTLFDSLTALLKGKTAPTKAAH